MATKITRQVLEAYLHCKTKAHLKLAGQQGNLSDYEAMLISNRHAVQQQAINKILDRSTEGEVARDIPITPATLRAGSSFMLNVTQEDGLFSLSFDGLKRVDGPSKLGRAAYSLGGNPVLDLSHPKTPHVFAAARQLDLILEYLKKISYSDSQGRLFLFERAAQFGLRQPSITPAGIIVHGAKDDSPNPSICRRMGQGDQASDSRCPRSRTVRQADRSADHERQSVPSGSLGLSQVPWAETGGS